VSEPTFSIVITAYQAAGTVATAVESALTQTHPALEVVVVDDGSTDDLDGALRPYAERIRVVRRENGGGAAARNTGAQAARGDFMAVLDADDAYHPRRLEAIAGLAQERPGLDLVTTDARLLRDGKEVGTFADATPFADADQRAAIFDTCFVGGWPAVRLSRLESIGGFDESFRIAYDWDCWLRAILDGAEAGFVDQPLYDYVLHAGSLSANRVASLWERARLLEKAADDPNLRAEERPALDRAIRNNRSRAATEQARASLYTGAPRLPLGRLAAAPRLEPHARLTALLAATAPPLARRMLPNDRLEGAAG
jgi:glycosyltransferase involved in cell wall biosynthesis